MNKTIRKKLRDSFLSVAGKFCRPSNSVHILNGHMLTRDLCNESHRLQFRNLLQDLHKKCEFINFDDAVFMIQSHAKVDHPMVAFSFDDGFTDCYYYLIPELERYNIRVGLFINPGFADAGVKGDEEYIHRFTNVFMHNDGKRPMSWKQIKELQKRGHIIGGHTIDHFMVSRGSFDELQYQIVGCKKLLEEKLQYQCDYFAWPYGKLIQANEGAVQIASENYAFVFSQADHKHYFSFNGKVINRRHFEAWWPSSHVKYFLSCKRKY